MWVDYKEEESEEIFNVLGIFGYNIMLFILIFFVFVIYIFFKIYMEG